MRRCLIVVVSVVLAAASAATAATAATPDAHDRALARQLAAKVVALQKVATVSTGSDDKITKALQGCPEGLGKNPAVVFAMLPVLLIEVVNEARPLLLDVRVTLGAMHPHAALFRRWLSAQQAGIGQILAFDNHGKKIDYCAAAKVMTSKSPRDADVRAVLGVSLAQIDTLFSGSSSQASATISKLNPQMRTFLVAAGVRRSVAVQLTK